MILYVPIYVYTILCIFLSMSISIYDLWIYLSMYIPIYLSVSVCLSICLSIYLSIYLYVCLSIYLSIYPSICLSASFERVLCILCFFSFLISMFNYFLPFLLISTICFQSATIRGHENQLLKLFGWINIVE